MPHPHISPHGDEKDSKQQFGKPLTAVSRALLRAVRVPQTNRSLTGTCLPVCPPARPPARPQVPEWFFQRTGAEIKAQFQVRAQGWHMGQFPV